VLLENVRAIENRSANGSFLTASRVSVQIDRTLIVSQLTGPALNLNYADTPGYGVTMINTGIFVGGIGINVTGGVHDLRFSTIVSTNSLIAIDGNPNYVPNVVAGGLLFDGSCPDIALTYSSYNVATHPCGLFSVHPRAEILGDFDGEQALPRGIAVDGADCGHLSPVTVDLQGAPRPVDGNADGFADCDMGAYELQYPQDIVFRDSFEGQGL